MADLPGAFACILSHWYGEGGHPLCPPGENFAVGARHHYSTRAEGDTFAALQRPANAPDAPWTVLSRGHRTRYLACDACGHAEKDALHGRQPTAPPPLPPAADPVAAAPEPRPVEDARKPSGIERFRAARAARK